MYVSGSDVFEYLGFGFWIYSILDVERKKYVRVVIIVLFDIGS